MPEKVLFHVVLYDYVEGVVELREPYREDHLEMIRRYEESDRLVVAGAIGDPPHLGLLAMRTRADAEAFIAEDPYVAAGLVERSRVEPWTVVAGALLPSS